MSDRASTKDAEVHQLRQELENVKSTLQEPLTAKKVMVPMTTRAFFAGTLKPPVKDEQEQVLVKMGGSNLVELDRLQAINHLDGRIQSLSVADDSTTTANSDISTAAAGESSMEVEPSLPFFEIREELDESGREVKAEAINVAKQLELLQKKEGRKANASVVPTASEEKIQDEPEQLKPVTDSEYESLSNRLDMLARLEEETEHAKQENKVSAKKLQSKGWSKGFLNAKPKKRKSQPKKVPARTSSTPSNEERKVAFQSQDEIREIPRVGERSASELKTTGAAPRRQIEPQVFSGVIRERSVESAPANASPSTKAPPRKKLSKFAQERQEQQR